MIEAQIERNQNLVDLMCLDYRGHTFGVCRNMTNILSASRVICSFVDSDDHSKFQRYLTCPLNYDSNRNFPGVLNMTDKLLDIMRLTISMPCSLYLVSWYFFFIFFFSLSILSSSSSLFIMNLI